MKCTIRCIHTRRKPTRDARSRLRLALMWLTLLRSCFRRAPSSHPAGAGSATLMCCPVCEEAAPLLDRLDFNKSCEEARGKRLPRSGTLVDYHLCESCGFCFAPQFREWDRARFAQDIYNDDYVEVDPDYVDALTYKNILLRMQANLEPDVKKRQPLLDEADKLKNKAIELGKKKASGLP